MASNDYVRNKINSIKVGEIALRYFEERYGKVEFYRVSNGFFNMFAAGAKGYADDVICSCKSIEGLIWFMHGAVSASNGEIEKQMKKGGQ